LRIGEKHINIENPAAADSTVAAATADNMAAAAAALSQLDDEIVHGMAIGAVFTDYVSSIAKIPNLPTSSLSAPYLFTVVSARIRLQAGKINCLDFHRKEDLLVTSSEDDSIRLYNITSAT